MNTFSRELDIVRYRVAVREEDGADETVIRVEPKDFVIQEDMEESPGTVVELDYCKAKLHAYPQDYWAVLDAWPHRAWLVLYKPVAEGHWEEVFVGAVTRVGTDDDEVRVAAHQKAESGVSADAA